MSATSLIQQLREALVGVLDTHPDVIALTGRDAGNIVDFRDVGEETALPVLVYEFQSATPGGTITSSRIRFQFTACALSQGQANELIAVVPGAIGYLASLDAIQDPDNPPDFSDGDDERLLGAFLAAVTLTFLA